jgi:hypothetical protein
MRCGARVGCGGHVHVWAIRVRWSVDGPQTRSAVSPTGWVFLESKAVSRLTVFPVAPKPQPDAVSAGLLDAV